MEDPKSCMGQVEDALSLTPLNTTRSLKRTLLTLEEGAKLSASPGEKPLSRSRTGNSSMCDFLTVSSTHLYLRFCAFFALVALLGMLVLTGHPQYDGWLPFSTSCGGSDGSQSSVHRAGRQVSSDNEELSAAFASHEPLNDMLPEDVMDEKCWSRTRHLLLRSEEQQFQFSSALKEAWKEYEAMHSRCTRHKEWRKALGEPSKDVPDSCQYLVYVEGWEGVGNRLLSLVSAFTYALATHRALLLDPQSHLWQMLCEPFENSSWALPPDVNLTQGISSLESKQIENEVAVRVNLRHDQVDQQKQFFCPGMQKQLSRVPWILWSSNQYFVPRFFMVPRLWEKLAPLFPDPSLVFTHFSRTLLLPENKVWVKTERIYRSYLTSAQRLVGVQVRIPELLNYSQRVQDRVMKCLIDNRFLPNVSVTEPSTIQMRSGSVRNMKSKVDLSIMVTSLESQYYESMRDFYMDQSTTDGSLVSVHMVSHEGQERFAYDQAVKAFIEIWLLSFSHDLATSGWSTFGYVAQGLSGRRPLIMILRESVKGPICYGGQSIEPCNHYPFLSNCGSEKPMLPEHDQWLKLHLRSCQDELHGLQLM